MRESIGKIYTITNEIENKIEIFNQYEDGTLETFKKVSTGGKGTDQFSLYRGSDAPPLASCACITTPDSEFLFCCNSGDNTVSSFEILADGDLKLIDRQPTQNGVKGSLLNLTYNSEYKVLYAGHIYGAHISSFKVQKGKLELFGKPTYVNTDKHPIRVMSSVLATPDKNYLLAHILGEGIHTEENYTYSIEDNIVVLKVNNQGEIIDKKFFSIGKENYASIFITNNRFLMTAVRENNASLLEIDKNGELSLLSSVKIADYQGYTIADTCWQTYDPQTKTAYVSNFGYSSITSIKVNDDKLKILNDQEKMIPGTGNFIGVGDLKSSAPTDILQFNRFVYQIYSAVGLLIAYAINSDGSLVEIARYDVRIFGHFGLVGV